jgi:Endonuclease/Exonuclease/phosphatase family
MNHGKIDTDTAESLKLLLNTIKEFGLPSSKLDETLIVASWNIREFGKARRPKKALHLVAEILGQFDLIAIVELREDLADLAEVLSYLGPYWSAVYSDTVDDAGGNGERIGFVFDTRAVQFNGFAGNVQPSRKKEGEEYLYDKAFWRPPYLASFSSGNFDFIAIAAHIRWGKSGAARTDEISRLAEWIKKKTARENFADKDVIVFGDFNTEGQDMIKELTNYGLKIPKALEDVRTNVNQTAHYDHILYLPKFTDHRSFTNQGGCLQAWQAIGELLFPNKTDGEITYLLSDHYPIWMKLKTDVEEELLDQLIRPRKQG